jgi:hypothetical protein
MPEPKLELALKYLTATQARKRLGLSRYQFDLRIERGIFPRPTYVDTVKRGDVILQVRYFDENWVKVVQTILDNSRQGATGSAL